MELSAECLSCMERMDFTTEPPDTSDLKPDHAKMTVETVVCPHCGDVFEVESYFTSEGYIGSQPFYYATYEGDDF